MNDAPETTGVPHPPVSIVVVARTIHNSKPTAIFTNGHKTTITARLCPLSTHLHRNIIQLRFCYDDCVWQQDAVKTGRFAIKHGRSFFRHIIPSIIKPIHSLWNQVIGFVFLCLGTIFGFAGFRYLSKGDGFRFVVATASALLMAWFGVSSFWKARKISRS